MAGRCGARNTTLSRRMPTSSRTRLRRRAPSDQALARAAVRRCDRRRRIFPSFTHTAPPASHIYPRGGPVGGGTVISVRKAGSTSAPTTHAALRPPPPRGGGGGDPSRWDCRAATYVASTAGASVRCLNQWRRPDELERLDERNSGACKRAAPLHLLRAARAVRGGAARRPATWHRREPDRGPSKAAPEAHGLGLLSFGSRVVPATNGLRVAA